MAEDVRWQEPWFPVTDPRDRPGLEGELRREVGPNHLLAGVEVTLVARRRNADDALFVTEDGRFAEVHLTWRAVTESDPSFPATTVYRSLHEWARTRMASG